jgi:hypothetical protein
MIRTVNGTQKCTSFNMAFHISRIPSSVFVRFASVASVFPVLRSLRVASWQREGAQ